MAIALAHHNSMSSAASDTTIVSSTMATTTGNLLVVTAKRGGTNISMSIADTASNTWTLIQTKQENSVIGGMSMWYAKNITGNASNVVTVTLGSTAAARSMIVLEYSGCDTSAPLDANPTPINTTVTSTSKTSNTFSTTSANEVIVNAATQNTGGTWTAGSIGGTTATTEETVPSNDQSVEDLIVSSTQNNITATYSEGNHAWIMFTASFKAAAGGGGVINSNFKTLLGVGNI